MRKLILLGTKRKTGAETLPFKQRLEYCLQLAQAIHYLHHECKPDQRLLHRDLKAKNICFKTGGHVVLLDFSTGRFISKNEEYSGCNERNIAPNFRIGEEDPEDSLKGDIDRSKEEEKNVFDLTAGCGTPRYMAPEVWAGRPYNEACDVYSFALLAWEMLTGELPYRRVATPRAFARRVVRGGLRPSLDRCAKSWPPRLRALLRACWADAPARRPRFPAIVRELQQLVRAEEAGGRGEAAAAAAAAGLQRWHSSFSLSFASPEGGGGRRGRSATWSGPGRAMNFSFASLFAFGK